MMKFLRRATYMAALTALMGYMGAKSIHLAAVILLPIHLLTYFLLCFWVMALVVVFCRQWRRWLKSRTDQDWEAYVASLEAQERAKSAPEESSHDPLVARLADRSIRESKPAAKRKRPKGNKRR